MPLVIPEDYAHVQVVFPAQSGLPEGAEFTFGIDNTVGDLSAATLATSIAALLTSSGIRNAWCDDVAPVSVIVKRGPNVTGTTASAPYTQVGGQTGTVGAAATSILVKKNTALGGRKGRGRMYIPGQSESAIDIGGIVGATTLTDVQSRCDTLLAGLAAADIPMVLLHNSNVVAPTPVTSLTVEALVGNIRRRQRR